MSLHVHVTSDTIHEPEKILMYLYDCKQSGSSAVLDLKPEGPCLESAGFYRLLDLFCEKLDYDPGMITIRTANMVEHSDRYDIKRVAGYWYEISMIHQWVPTRVIDTSNRVSKHFGNFVGQSSWERAWIAAWLHRHHGSRTLQTFHTGLRAHYRTKETDGVYDQVGLENLVKYECDMIPQVVEFLDGCPRVIPEDLEQVKKTDIGFFKQESHYPLQHPANLNIVDWYRYFFVDIITETNVVGNSFLTTEKTWRCMLAKRPFIMLGSRDFLYNLHKLGFKTFYDFWDENYDGQENQTRMKMIQQQIDIIAGWSMDELGQKLVEMEPILEHNRQRFLELRNKDLEITFNATE